MRTTKSMGLHMNRGNAETSYANNSSLQQKAILMTKQIRERAITELCSKISPKTISIADLGCSSGPNALLVSLEIVQSFCSATRNLGQEPPQIQVFLNDLSGNDFNNLFKLVTKLQENLVKKEEDSIDIIGRCFFAGVPGSFYHRLFPAKSLHFVQSSYSLHYLSQVPEGIQKSNKTNIYLENTSSTSVAKAYYDQFHKDFSKFLENRSVELVPGGCMVLTILGRKSVDPREDGFLLFELLAQVLSDMVAEGLLEEEKLQSFNIPNYMPSQREIQTIIKEEGSFNIDHLEIFEIHWSAHRNGPSSSESSQVEEVGYGVAKAIRYVL